MARWLPVVPTSRTCTQGSVACAGICIGDGHRRNCGALTHKVAAARTSNTGKESLERPPAGSKSSALSHLSFSVDGSTIRGRNSGEWWHTRAQNGLVRDVEREDGGQVFFFRDHKQNPWAARCALWTVCISSTMRRESWRAWKRPCFTKQCKRRTDRHTRRPRASAIGEEIDSRHVPG